MVIQLYYQHTKMFLPLQLRVQPHCMNNPNRRCEILYYFLPDVSILLMNYHIIPPKTNRRTGSIFPDIWKVPVLSPVGSAVCAIDFFLPEIVAVTYRCHGQPYFGLYQGRPFPLSLMFPWQVIEGTLRLQIPDILRKDRIYVCNV